ncbi:unnamed protein product [Nezara viridula]|uniref:Uncharacterized protein n=1 Tax=Nezara viridula TaxID=85310 RepID=A0A9P0E8J4_NEZVI|nr:unnamed protein product [Nezara viridula]
MVDKGGCENPLGMETGAIPDEAVTASSSYVPNVGAKNGRESYMETSTRDYPEFTLDINRALACHHWLTPFVYSQSHG